MRGMKHDLARDLVQRYVIYTELPHKVIDIADMYLVGFWCKKGFKQPLAVVDLTDMAQLLEDCNALVHNWSLAWPIVDFLHADWVHLASVDNTLVISDGYELPFIVKNRLVFLDEVIDLVPYAHV